MNRREALAFINDATRLREMIESNERLNQIVFRTDIFTCFNEEMV